MGLKSRKILGISVTTESKKTILEYIQKCLELSNYPIIQLSNKRRKPLVVVTPNPEQIVLAQDNPHFARILNQADVALPDGIGLALASRFLKDQKSKIKDQKELQRIPGVEFMEDLVGMAAKRGYPVALIGGRGGVAVEALECLQARHPGLVGWVLDPGDVDVGNLGDLGDLCEKIQKTKTRFVFVGLGVPKQEFFIERIVHRLQCTVGTKRNNSSSVNYSLCAVYSLVLMSVGGSFDIIAGRVKRAPWIARSMGLEWLWRLIREPWRFCRQLALIKFLWLVLGEKLASKG